jgi:hypothetical protein
VWGLNSVGEIWRFNGQIQNWDPIPGALAHITTPSDYVVSGLDSVNLGYEYLYY